MLSKKIIDAIKSYNRRCVRRRDLHRWAVLVCLTVAVIHLPGSVLMEVLRFAMFLLSLLLLFAHEQILKIVFQMNAIALEDLEETGQAAEMLATALEDIKANPGNDVSERLASGALAQFEEYKRQ